MSLELSPEGGWLNTDRPPGLGADQTGRVVLAWFFCAGSSATVESLDDLRALESRFDPQTLSIIGVYSPQYRAEARWRHVVNAVDRLEVGFPVAFDSGQAMFRAFGARSWPTFVIFGPDGTCAARVGGAGNRELLERTIAELVGRRVTAGGASRQAASRHRSAGALRFPGSVCAQTPSVGRDGRLFIADTGHHRIVEANWPTPDGETSARAIYGGEPGRADGTRAGARFREPRGMAYDPEREILFVADAGNHAVRSIDTRTGRVTTVIGTGVRGFDRRGGASGTNQPINTPTDVLLDAPRNRLIIAMSGLNQLWSADLDTLVIRAFAGSGEMKVIDGDLDRAAFWQPRALAADPARTAIYSLDADASALRQVDTDRRAVRTLIGSPQGYTGDRDGPLTQAQLCHPTGLALVDDAGKRRLIIADTYNDALRAADLAAGTVARFARDLCLFEPGGVDWAGALASTTDRPRLFVCDTGNHRVLQTDAEGSAWQELRIGGLSGAGEYEQPERAAFNVPMRTPLRVSVGLRDAPGVWPSEDMPVCVRVSAIEGTHAGRALAQVTTSPAPASMPFQLDLPAEVIDAQSVLLVELSLGLEYAGARFARPAFKAWRVRFGTDGGEPTLMAQIGR